MGWQRDGIEMEEVDSAQAFSICFAALDRDDVLRMSDQRF